MSEQWKDVVGLEGYYAVSDNGNVHSYHVGRKMKAQERNHKKDAYLQIGLAVDGKQTFFLIHRLVAQAFLKNDLSKDDYVSHINGNHSCNLVGNLKIIPSTFGIKLTLEEKKACVRKKRDRYYGYYYCNNGKQVHVGVYDSESEAREAAVSAKTLAQQL